MVRLATPEEIARNAKHETVPKPLRGKIEDAAVQIALVGIFVNITSFLVMIVSESPRNDELGLYGLIGGAVLFLFGLAVASLATPPQEQASTNVDRPSKQISYQRYQGYLNSPEWFEKRSEALARAGQSCQVCNSQWSLEVHHRSYDRLGNEEPGDLTVLCRKCHQKFHDELGAF